MNNEQKKDWLDKLLKNNILVSQDFFDSLPEEFDFDGFFKTIKEKNIFFIDRNTLTLVEEEGTEEKKTEQKQGDTEKDKTKEKQEIKEERAPLKILFNYKDKLKKKEFQDFVKYFNNRFRALEKILRKRQELSGITSINRILQRTDKQTVYIIGIIREKSITKNKNIILTLEDPTAEINVVVTTNNKEAHNTAKQLVLDEVIGVIGNNRQNTVFATKILLPDIPTHTETKKSTKEEYVLFLSDLHVGSNNFLEEEFEKFLKWINGELGEKHKKIIENIKYIFIAGDLVDGVGVYPNQEEELEINDLYEQYKICAGYLAKIPKHIHIIVCPGNHDAMRLAEPQLPLYEDFAKPLYDLENVTILSNPCVVNIASSENFSGFDVLMYHGFSFDYFVSNIDKIRNGGGYDRGDLIMKFLLQRRHLAPSHTATLYTPDTEKDPLVIETVPDFFVTGHIHKTAVANYRSTTMICGSCWQSKTTFQEKVGHHPEPCRVPVVNLQTREVKILKFT